MYAVVTELSQLPDQLLARTIEVLIDILQPFRSYCLHSNQSSHDPRLAHGLEKIRILGRLHRNLCKENGVFRQLREARHQLEALAADAVQLSKSLNVVLSLS